MNDAEKQLMGKRIRSERRKMGLSQDALAEKLDMNRANISNYESGRTIPPGNILVDLANIFEVETDYLLGRQCGDNSGPEIRAIQRAAKKMSEKERKKMLNMLKIAFDEAFDEKS